MKDKLEYIDYVRIFLNARKKLLSINSDNDDNWNNYLNARKKLFKQKHKRFIEIEKKYYSNFG